MAMYKMGMETWGCDLQKKTLIGLKNKLEIQYSQ